MTDFRAQAKHVDALGQWFEKRGIGPSEAVSLMATAIGVAIISGTMNNSEPLTAGVSRAEAAALLVLERFNELLEVHADD